MSIATHAQSMLLLLFRTYQARQLGGHFPPARPFLTPYRSFPLTLPPLPPKLAESKFALRRQYWPPQPTSHSESAEIERTESGLRTSEFGCIIHCCCQHSHCYRPRLGDSQCPTTLVVRPEQSCLSSPVPDEKHSSLPSAHKSRTTQPLACSNDRLVFRLFEVVPGGGVNSVIAFSPSSFCRPHMKRPTVVTDLEGSDNRQRLRSTLAVPQPCNRKRVLFRILYHWHIVVVAV